MREVLVALLSDKLIHDDRLPIPLFHIPSFLGGGVCGVLPPNLAFWVQLTILLMVQMAISCAFAVAVYTLIVEKKHDNTRYVVGFGIVIPLVLYIPFQFLIILDIQSKTLSMSLVALPILVTFRCMEAMGGFTPEAAGKSLKNYTMYYASLMETLYDNKTMEPMQASLHDLLLQVLRFIRLVVALSMFFSFTRPYDYAPFVTRLEAISLQHSLADMLDPSHLANNFIAAALVSVSLSISTLGPSLLFNILTGKMTGKVVDNPMFASKSPSEFWGARWNQLVHKALKRGVFKPIRKVSNSKNVAVVATFLMSGLMHEYVWSILFYVHEHQIDPSTGVCSDCFQPIYGKNMLFFGWNGIVIVLETLIGGWWIFQEMKRILPGPIITTLVIMTALPTGHWFTGDWIIGEYFSHFQLGFPILVRIEE